MAKLFSKEKDTFLKILNAILILGAIFSVIICLATGVGIINNEKIDSYEEYAKKVCTIDKLEYECTDEECIKELDTERKKTCTKNYLNDKKEKQAFNKSNVNNFIISLISTLILLIIIHFLNKKI